jgi:hypothetical protein
MTGPTGLDIVKALTGVGGWGTQITPDQSRVVRARLGW